MHYIPENCQTDHSSYLDSFQQIHIITSYHKDGKFIGTHNLSENFSRLTTITLADLLTIKLRADLPNVGKVLSDLPYTRKLTADLPLIWGTLEGVFAAAVSRLLPPSHRIAHIVNTEGFHEALKNVYHARFGWNSRQLSMETWKGDNLMTCEGCRALCFTYIR